MITQQHWFCFIETKNFIAQNFQILKFYILISLFDLNIIASNFQNICT